MAELNIDGQTIERLPTENTTTSTATNGRNGKKKNQPSSDPIVQTKKEVIKLENGCICCTLRGDLIREISRIQEEATFDYILIESTGIAEPQQVAESFCVDPHTQQLAGNDDSMLWNSARLDTCVTVVDAVNFPEYLSSLKRFKDLFQDGLEDEEDNEGQKSISQLMVEQVEFANVIIVNKVDLVSEQQLETAQKLIHTLNPKATVLTGSYGEVDLKQILNTHMFNMEEASNSPGWLLSLEGGLNASHGEADEYGVNSFVFRSRKPFHPQRLYHFVRNELGLCPAQEWNSKTFSESSFIVGNDPKKDTTTTTTVESNGGEGDKKKDDGVTMTNKYGSILRSKGTCWIAGKDDYEMSWAQSGRIIQISPSGPWYCLVDPNNWQGVHCQEDHDRVENLFYEIKKDDNGDESRGERYEYDDRRQEFVIIGTKLQQAEIEKELNHCLLTDIEMSEFSFDLPHGAYIDPWIPMRIPCKEADNFSVIVRQKQNQYFQIYSGLSLTLNHLSLHVIDKKNPLPIRAVKVWLDRSRSVRGGCLLATLRPEQYEQHSMSLKLLPPDMDKDEGPSTNDFRFRIEILLSSSSSSDHITDTDLMEACEVHIFGTVEPLPFSKAESDDDDEEDEEDDQDHEHDDAGICQ